MPQSYYKYAYWSLLFAGVCLWLMNWGYGRALFIDEANVARNLFDRSWSGLFQPLDHQQYAPPLYLVLTKLCGEVFGYGELSLRLPALLGGGLCIYSLTLAGKALKLGWWTLLPLALLFVNPTVLRYVGEVKPYALDLGLAALILALALRQGHNFSIGGNQSNEKRWWFWSIIGIVVVWWSLPAVFVLAGIGLYALLTDRKEGKWKRWGSTGLLWILSFIVLYALVLRPSISDPYLNSYHQAYFFPLPKDWSFAWLRALRLITEQPKLAFGYTSIAIFFGLAMTLVALLQFPNDRKTLLISPLLLAFVASAFEQYSLIPRLLLFTLPGWWLLAAIGSKYVYQTNTLAIYWRYGLLAVWLIVLGGTNVVRHYYDPMQFSEARQVSLEAANEYKTILHKSAVPGYDYYRRIHPVTGDPSFTPVTAGNVQSEVFPGKYLLLYGATAKKSAQQDQKWATERGCKVRDEGSKVYLDCGE